MFLKRKFQGRLIVSRGFVSGSYADYSTKNILSFLRNSLVMTAEIYSRRTGKLLVAM